MKNLQTKSEHRIKISEQNNRNPRTTQHKAVGMKTFGLHVLSDTSSLGEETGDMQYSIRYNICPLGFEQCFAVRDPDIFNATCQGNFDSCQNYINDAPVSEKDFESGVYAVQFHTKYGAIALSGAREKN